MYSHAHDEAETHLAWCPASKVDTPACLCKLLIYGSMFMIGGVTVTYEYTFGKQSGASGPIADVWHLGSDMGSDGIVFLSSILLLIHVFKPHVRFVRRVTAWLQVALLMIAVALVYAELYEKILHTKAMHIEFMIIAGAIGTAGNFIRLYILHLRHGSWDINRVIQDKHARADLYYSVYVLAAGIAIYISATVARMLETEFIGFLTLTWLDYVVVLVILQFLLNVTYEAAEAAWRGRLAHRH